MKYIEVKECPSDINDNNKYEHNKWPGEGIYLGPSESELFFIDASGIPTSCWINDLIKFVKDDSAEGAYQPGSGNIFTERARLNNMEVEKTYGVEAGPSLDSLLKILAVAQKPELAFKDE